MLQPDSSHVRSSISAAAAVVPCLAVSVSHFLISPRDLSAPRVAHSSCSSDAAFLLQQQQQQQCVRQLRSYAPDAREGKTRAQLSRGSLHCFLSLSLSLPLSRSRSLPSAVLDHLSLHASTRETGDRVHAHTHRAAINSDQRTSAHLLTLSRRRLLLLLGYTACVHRTRMPG